MSKTTKFNWVSDSVICEISKTADSLKKESIKVQKEKIAAESPYSNDINEAFSGYNEFYYLFALGLQEATITRPALVRNIDFNLYITEKGKTNYELMLEGASPYAEDSPNSCIILHHIGQSFDAPFAELTEKEHASYGNSKLLHNNKLLSWRNDERKLIEFQKEKNRYWRKRATSPIAFTSNNHPGSINEYTYNYEDDNISKIKAPIEKLFSECSINDLIYIANLANGYALLKEVGASTVEDFILSLNKEDEDKCIKCPRCKSKNIIYYGYSETRADKKQRYRCNDCGSVFSLFSNTIISGCSLTLLDWIRFIDCLYNGYSLKKTALICGFSEKSCFDLRNKLFYALEILESKIKLEGKIVLDETYLHENKKGNHTHQKDFTLGRAPRKRGNGVEKTGTSKDQVCVMCALDDCGNSVAKITGLGGPNHRKIDLALKNCFEKTKVDLLISDSSKAIKLFAEKSGYSIIQTQFDRKRKRFIKNPHVLRYIQKINAYHSRLKNFIAKFNGVSTDMLSGYLCLFSWKDRNRGNPPIEAYKELLEIMVEPNREKPLEDILKEQLSKSPSAIEAIAKLRRMRNKEKYDKIYALYAKGVKQKEIAQKFNCTPQAVCKAIKIYLAAGYGYKTEKERLKDQEFVKSLAQKRAEYCIAKKANTYARNKEILETFEVWTDDKEKFYLEMYKKHRLSKQTIKNVICEAKRIRALKKVFYINENYEFSTLHELFELVYKRYSELSAKQPKMLMGECYDMLAKEFGYTRHMIISIINKMKGNDINWNDKKKMPASQVLNRDISVFIDFMKWTGTKKEFYAFTKQKYNIGSSVTSRILSMNCLADPTRYDRIKDY